MMGWHPVRSGPYDWSAFPTSYYMCVAHYSSQFAEEEEEEEEEEEQEEEQEEVE